jgi:hypothetical protein
LTRAAVAVITNTSTALSVTSPSGTVASIESVPSTRSLVPTVAGRVPKSTMTGAFDGSSAARRPVPVIVTVPPAAAAARLSFAVAVVVGRAFFVT